MRSKKLCDVWKSLMIAGLILGSFAVSGVFGDAQPVHAAEVTDTFTVDELMYERKFSIRSTQTGNYVSGVNGAYADGVSAEDVLVLRYGEEGADWADDVPTALYLDASGGYLTLGTSARAGDGAWLNAALLSDGSQQFILEKAPDWSKSNLSYYIYHPKSGLYLGVNNNKQLYACGKTAPDSSFVFTKTGYSDVGLLTTLDGYQNLSPEHKKRVLDVYGGVGARSLYRWGGFDNEWTIENNRREIVKNIYANRDNTTAEEEAAALLDGMNMVLFDGQTNWYGLPEIPGTIGMKTVLSEGIYGTYDFWRGTMLNGNLHTFSIIDDYGTHTMEIYIEDNWTAQTNANNLMEAIKQIPFPVRRNIRTIKVRNDGANSYNCGQNDLYMRLNWTPSAGDIAQYLTHEFGHSMDFSYSINWSGRWQAAIDADMIDVSGYGNTNGYEDFAEFGRLYFQMYGNYNSMYAMRQVYPNRYRVYVDALGYAQYADIYENHLFLPNQEQEALYDDVIASFNFDDTVEGLRSGTAIARASGGVVLDDNGYSGKALKLDGTGSNFLSVMNRDTTNLLNGYESFTISYYSKPETDNGSWSVFLAPNGNAQTYLQERYIGILDKTNAVSVERYNCYGSRSESLDATGLSGNEWRHVALVVEKNKTALYVNGELVSEKYSDSNATDILGKNSVFQIGKGNWGWGEYYAGLIDEFTVYGRALSQEEIQNQQENQIVAYLSFDDSVSGLKGANAQAAGNGRWSISNGGVSGNSLYLDGSGYMNVAKTDGSSLLTGCDEVTISYYSKADNDGAMWSMFLSPNAEGQNVNFEKYLGILDRKGSVNVERYNNNGARPTSIFASASADGAWRHVAVVFANGMTTLYIDGEQVGYVRSEYNVAELLGNNSVFQIGKGNWGNGEFYKGYIDEVTVWNGALSKVELDAYLAQNPADIVMDIEVTAPSQTEYREGDAFNADGLAVTAICLKGTKDVTAEAVVSGFDSNVIGTQTITVSYGGMTRTFDVLVKEKPVLPEVLAEFDFDDADGFTNGYGIATGNYGLKNHPGGKSLYLDGSDDFLEVKNVDGSSLLTFAEELTVSFHAKPDASYTNWTFYAAPNANTQNYATEKYLGVLNTNGTIYAERFNNTNGRPQSASAFIEGGQWYYMTVVQTAEETILYVNGAEVSRQSSAYALTDILGENSVLYIGKANWGNGEYYKGLIDNYTILSRAMSSEEVAAQYQAIGAEPGVYSDELAYFSFDNETEGFTNGNGIATGTYTLQDSANGKALYLDGSDDFLTVTKADGSSLLTGKNEMTVSFLAKPETSNVNWLFYAAPNADTQAYAVEKYVGVLNTNGTILAERFNNTNGRPGSATAYVNGDQWYHIAVVQTAGETIIYVNGYEVSRQGSNYSLTDILGNNSILYIGKANWGNGEYYRGLIDEYKIVGRAWTAEEVLAEAARY